MIRIRGMNLLHFILVTAVMLAAWFNMYVPLLEAQIAQTVSIAVCVCYFILSIFFYRTYNAYKIGMHRARETFYAETLANLFSDGITYLFACLIQLKALHILPVLLVFLIQTFISGIWCRITNRIYFKLHKPLRTLVIYKSDEDLEKFHEIAYFESRFSIQSKLKNPQDIFDVLPEIAGYQAVIVSGIDATMRNGIVKECIDKNIGCFFIPHTGDVIIAGAKHVQSFSVPIMEAKRAALRPEYAFAKRALDIILSSFALIVASPLMIVATLMIRAYDHGPALYKQVRLTKNGKSFTILKFRSMCIDAEKDGVARLASDHDRRITPIGKVMRAVRFDEFPQFINILKGDMSIVGPRPERPEIAARYEKEIPAFSLRLQVKAGLTGMAQVYGKYDTAPKDKLKMDLMYINNMSLMEDLRLIFATAKVLLMKESSQGISRGQVTAADGEKVEKGA